MWGSYLGDHYATWKDLPLHERRAELACTRYVRQDGAIMQDVPHRRSTEGATWTHRGCAGWRPPSCDECAKDPSAAAAHASEGVTGAGSVEEDEDEPPCESQRWVVACMPCHSRHYGAAFSSQISPA